MKYHIYVMCVKVLQDILFKYNKISSKDLKDIKKYSCKRRYIIHISSENDLYFFKWSHIIFIALTDVAHYFLQRKRKELIYVEKSLV